MTLGWRMRPRHSNSTVNRAGRQVPRTMEVRKFAAFADFMYTRPMNMRDIGVSIALGVFGAMVIACAGGVLDEMKDLAPEPGLSFAEVVEIQLTALANDNENNEGIALAYRFAAPSNKRAVGPLERFVALFDNELYSPMLDPLETEFLDSVQRRGTAYQGVRIRNAAGRDFYYVFILERQKIGDIKDCWMTAGVRTFMDAPIFQEESPEGVNSA